MTKILNLLKYLDRDKITPEAVLEIAAVFGFGVDPSVAADVSQAFKTRGMAGLLPYLPALMQSPREFNDPQIVLAYMCKHCGHLGKLTATLSEIQAAGEVVQDDGMVQCQKPD